MKCGRLWMNLCCGQVIQFRPSGIPQLKGGGNEMPRHVEKAPWSQPRRIWLQMLPIGIKDLLIGLNKWLMLGSWH
jgi:hypothetical protein